MIWPRSAQSVRLVHSAPCSRGRGVGVLPRVVDTALLEKNKSSGKPAFSDSIDPVRGRPAAAH